MKKYIFFLSVLSALKILSIQEKPLVVVIASYKNAAYYAQNLDSVLSQDYSNYRVIYTDDNSPDDTGRLVKEYLSNHHLAHKVTLIQNSERKGALANIYRAVHLCDPHEIIVSLDGDDWFSNDQVLTRVNQEYQNNNVWLTYGQFVYSSCNYMGCCQELPFEPVEIRRHHEWVTSHLRTFYAGLFHQIAEYDLKDENNTFYGMAWDLAIMIPMIEMAGSRISFIPDILYVYNDSNPMCDHAVNRQLQYETDLAIRRKPSYCLVDSYYNPYLYE